MTRIGDVGTANVVENDDDKAYYETLALLKYKQLSLYSLKNSIASPYVQKNIWLRTLHIAFPKKIKELKTPLKLNGLINGKTIAIKRDNPADTLHLGKEVSLKIYDRQEIAAGQSRYQIAQQLKFERGSPLHNDRRGDVLLLINGMPVIHVELKRSGIPVSQAVNQIEKYSAEGVFSGLFSLIQVFVAMG